MPHEISYTDPHRATDGVDTLFIIGRRDRLLGDDVAALLPKPAAAMWSAMLDAASPGDAGCALTTFTGLEDGPGRVMMGVLPEPCSRHNSPARPHAVTTLAGKAPSKGKVAVVLALDEAAHALAAGVAVSRALPLYSRKTSDEDAAKSEVRVAMLPDDEKDIDLDRIAIIAENARFAARLVDTPTNELHTDAFVDLARETAARVGADVSVLQGEALAHAGLGGIWAVGKAANRPPALVVLTHTPDDVADDAKTIAVVGKGIVYDTGGLSLKSKAGMPGMKGDMGGAAAVLGAFGATVRTGTRHKVIAILCLAENAIGPDAVRNDDVITMYSGKTVEINNTDAEGRLVTSDGVAWAARHHNPDIIMNLATLTGAQLVATGKRHSGSYCNDDDLEALAVKVGKATGDLVHPLPYVPEFFRKEFKSDVADMKNSVKDRGNAQSSCAAQFIANHLGDYAGLFLHFDIAGPSGHGDRATGYGVALLTELFAAL